MNFKKLFIFLIVLGILYFSIGVYLLVFHQETFQNIPKKEVILKAPIYAFELIKSWVVSL